MVDLSTVHASNESISNTLPPGSVAIFVGATSGIGKASLLHYAKHAPKPRIYFVGRSQKAADEILQQLNEANPDGSYEFIISDVSLLKNVDEVCNYIQTKEKAISLLYQSQGTLDVSAETSEKLSLIMALSYYCRMRFIENLLPLLRQSPSFGRVIVVLAGTKEGPINPADIPGKRVLPWKARGHMCSMITLTLEHFAREAPEVSFIHSYPGFVDTPLSRTMKGFTGTAMKATFSVMRLFRKAPDYISLDETGERYTYLATSSIFPAKSEYENSDSIGGDTDRTAEVTVGSTGVRGAGAYIVDENCEAGDESVQRILEGLRSEGVDEKVWRHLQDEFLRITEDK